MTDTHTGPATTADPADDPDQSPDGSQPRGLFGRLFDALSPTEAQAQAESPLSDAMRQVLPGLANLRRLRVEDVAIPKAEIVAVPRDIARADLIEVFRDSGFSRIPVYNETLDKPMGLLLLKDLVLRQGFDLNKGDPDVVPMLRPLLFVPPSMPLVVLLQKMQTERTHMALVIDEYGGVEGLVTIEDLLEQVVGQIDDEHDTADEHPWTEESLGVWLMQARAMLDDIREALGIDLREAVDDEDVDTLGGLVFLLAGRVPARGEVIAHPAGHEIEVLDADPRRVKRLRLRRAGSGGTPDPTAP
ncbi:MAG: CBS domain-containing protein [Rhodobacter sp.]|uniref:transporter associated domain-containing protein n=1 Tax=Pararhodobacter sp. TaxID=2127056 RepID=UPI001D2EDD9B|nr:transporter associated domain-containing protein [Pararhodobacter sp.]MCB1347019.1 CBS domain-containing protein [Paracoccaceae bacterium]MCC0074585.1 CBS domain-containing protein [Rhodobacter sp.]HPD92841.1 transporter associated domain-containing protein [Pararhodobacter sp.]